NLVDRSRREAFGVVTRLVIERDAYRVRRADSGVGLQRDPKLHIAGEDRKLLRGKCKPGFLRRGILDLARRDALGKRQLDLRWDVIGVRWMIRVDVPTGIHRCIDDK